MYGGTMTGTNYHRYRITFFDRRMWDAPWQTVIVQADTASHACRVITDMGLAVATITEMPPQPEPSYAD